LIIVGKWYNKGVSKKGLQVIFMSKSKYWPLDYDPEGEIYDNLAWDLPGFRRERRGRPKSKRRK
jgi:hypothetical protein